MRASCAKLIAPVVVAALLPWAAVADEALPAASYKLKEERPRTGTNIRSDVVTGSTIPLNRRYADMTDAERRSVKALYEAMPDADEPPFPIDGLAPVYRAVQQAVQKLQAKGEMVLVVNVDAAGEATGVQVLKSGDPELTRTVATIVMLTHYKPAVCAGKPCAMAFPFRISADLRW